MDGKKTFKVKNYLAKSQVKVQKVINQKAKIQITKVIGVGMGGTSKKMIKIKDLTEVEGAEEGDIKLIEETIMTITNREETIMIITNQEEVIMTITNQEETEVIITIEVMDTKAEETMIKGVVQEGEVEEDINRTGTIRKMTKMMMTGELQIKTKRKLKIPSYGQQTLTLRKKTTVK